MGEIADMMLDGIMCQLCGEFIDDPLGYPGLCPGCVAVEKRAKHKKKSVVRAEARPKQEVGP